jgi:hypothetical protein
MPIAGCRSAARIMYGRRHLSARSAISQIFGDAPTEGFTLESDVGGEKGDPTGVEWYFFITDKEVL